MWLRSTVNVDFRMMPLVNDGWSPVGSRGFASVMSALSASVSPTDFQCFTNAIVSPPTVVSCDAISSDVMKSSASVHSFVQLPRCDTQSKLSSRPSSVHCVSMLARHAATAGSRMHGSVTLTKRSSAWFAS